MMKKVLVVFGTRPEAIKMAPVIKALERSASLEPILCATGQHREILDQVLKLFQLRPDYDLNLMKPNQSLIDTTIHILCEMQKLLSDVKPDAVLVQGDTTSAFAAGLASYYLKIPIGHVEAGLRTGDKYSPFPEEVNRHALAAMIDFHFAPTPEAVANLRRENVPNETIYCTGNTSIDALLCTANQAAIPAALASAIGSRKLVLMTAHRRENFGEPLLSIFQAVKQFAQRNPNYHIVYPVHPNPNVSVPARSHLSGISNISLVAPLDYQDTVALMKECRFVVTDSGGLQEEAPTLGKPVIVVRRSTERQEAVKAGSAILVGHNRELILEKMTELTSEDSVEYRTMSRKAYTYGKGDAGHQIVSILEKEMGNGITKRREQYMARLQKVPLRLH